MTNTPAVIANYGMGNIRSLQSAISYIGYESIVSEDPHVISRAPTIFLPGVGSFPAAMDTINSSGISQALREAFNSGASRIFGICLGMQLMMKSTQEDGGGAGLGFLEGSVERFSTHTGLAVPHIGFNDVTSKPSSILFKGFEESAAFYFVHSYRVLANSIDATVATTWYGAEFVSAFEKENLFGTQFHPEKSQSNGLRLLHNFFSMEKL